jgi:hypothetical protein
MASQLVCIWRSTLSIVDFVLLDVLGSGLQAERAVYLSLPEHKCGFHLSVCAHNNQEATCHTIVPISGTKLQVYELTKTGGFAFSIERLSQPTMVRSYRTVHCASCNMGG